MCKYHSLFLTNCGSVYACGTGRDGRLGTGKENVLIEPQLINFEEKIIRTSASTHHSVFVTSSGQVNIEMTDGRANTCFVIAS